jgi:molybdate transport system ATP-binding protein
VIEIRLEKKLGAFSLDALIAAPEKGVIALFGPSGSGKTTIVNALAGLTKPDQGLIRLGDDVLFDSGKRIDVPAERRRIGYVFQDARLFPHMSVRDNLLYGERRAGTSPARATLNDVVDLLAIGPLLSRSPYGLSGGERQRIALGRALLSRPRLLLMDEPLASLDEARKAEVLPYLDRLHTTSGVPIIYVSHAGEEVTRLADFLVLLADGRVKAAGPLHELSSRIEHWGALGAAFTGAILEGSIVAHDSERLLSKIETSAGPFYAPTIASPVGSRVRLRIPARDVVLATAPPTGLSVQNILRGTLTQLVNDGAGRTRVQLDVAGTAVLAELTTDAARRLGLKQGEEAYALVKSVGFERL